MGNQFTFEPMTCVKLVWIYFITLSINYHATYLLVIIGGVLILPHQNYFIWAIYQWMQVYVNRNMLPSCYKHVIPKCENMTYAMPKHGFQTLLSSTPLPQLYIESFSHFKLQLTLKLQCQLWCLLRKLDN